MFEASSGRRMTSGIFTTKCIAITAFVLALLFVSSLLIGVSLKKLNSTEVGIEYDTQARDLGDVLEEGLHSGAPFFDILKYSAVLLSRQVEITCVSKDGLLLPLVASFQYRPKKEAIGTITKLYRNSREYDKVIVAAAKSAIHHGCGDFRIEEFQSRRLEVQETQKQYLVDILEGRLGQQGLMSTVNDVQLQNVDPPDRWESSVEAKESAREDIRLAENERVQRLTEADTRLKVAQQKARIKEAKAETTAEVLITRADAEAQALLNRFEKFANQTKLAMDTLGLDVKGVLRYLLNRQIESKKKLEVSMQQPVATPKDEL